MAGWKWKLELGLDGGANCGHVRLEHDRQQSGYIHCHTCHCACPLPEDREVRQGHQEHTACCLVATASPGSWTYLSSSPPLIRFQGSFTWIYWLPCRDMVRILRKASRILGREEAKYMGLSTTSTYHPCDWAEVTHRTFSSSWW